MIKAKRFWTDVAVENGRVLLDGRVLKTPTKAEVIIPYPSLAEAVADEWRAVEGEINPNNMPFTRMVNSAISHVSAKREEIIDHLIPYLETDLIIYRVDSPAELVSDQAAWDEWIEWAAKRGIKLTTTSGIKFVKQPASNEAVARDWLASLDDFALVGAHDAITLLGSFVLGWAMVAGDLSAERAAELTLIEESYQIRQWGDDELAAEQRAAKTEAILATAKYNLLVAK